MIVKEKQGKLLISRKAKTKGGQKPPSTAGPSRTKRVQDRRTSAKKAVAAHESGKLDFLRGATRATRATTNPKEAQEALDEAREQQAETEAKAEAKGEADAAAADPNHREIAAQISVFENPLPGDHEVSDRGFHAHSMRAVTAGGMRDSTDKSPPTVYNTRETMNLKTWGFNKLSDAMEDGDLFKQFESYVVKPKPLTEERAKTPAELAARAETPVLEAEELIAAQERHRQDQMPLAPDIPDGEVWKSLNNVKYEPRNRQITKKYGTNPGFNADAISALAADAIEATATETSKETRFGLSASNTFVKPGGLYAIAFAQERRCFTIIGSDEQTIVELEDYRVGDKAKVAVDSSHANFYVNGVLKRSVERVEDGDLYAVVSPYNPSGGVSEISLGVHSTNRRHLPSRGSVLSSERREEDDPSLWAPVDPWNHVYVPDNDETGDTKIGANSTKGSKKGSAAPSRQASRHGSRQGSRQGTRTPGHRDMSRPGPRQGQRPGSRPSAVARR